MSTCTVIRVADSSHRGEARRVAAGWAERLGFDEERGGRVALVATELATNLVKHVPGGGCLFAASVERHGAVGLELVALDAGPGIEDEARALDDGYSTAGGAGIGLGGVSRLSDAFDLYSSPGAGHGGRGPDLARVGPDEDRASPPAAICAMMAGETVSGDALAVRDVDGQTRIVVADGLGHGPRCGSEAASEAISIFYEADADSPGRSARSACTARLRATRGAAVAVAEIDPGRRSLTLRGRRQHLRRSCVGGDRARASSRTTARSGHSVRRIQEFSYPAARARSLVMHSDGLVVPLDARQLPGARAARPGLSPALLFRDFGRGRDDVDRGRRSVRDERRSAPC